MLRYATKFLGTAGLLAAAAISIAEDARAIVKPAFQARAASFSQQSCIIEHWGGLKNNCTSAVPIRFAEYNASSSGYYAANALAYGNSATTMQTWGVSPTLDWIWTFGVNSCHAATTLNERLWGGWQIGDSALLQCPDETYVPNGGLLRYNILLQPGDMISNFNW